MSIKYSDELKRDAVLIGPASGLTRCQIASDLSIGFQ